MSQSLTTSLERRDFLKLLLGSSVAAMGASALAPFALADASSEQEKGLPRPLVHGADEHGHLIATDFKPRLCSVDGISQDQLHQHLKLYEGYVKKINTIHLKLAEMDLAEKAKSNPTFHEFRELHVEQSYALNGAILHEYYFGNLGGTVAAASSQLKKLIHTSFGSWETYIADLMAVGKSMRGWAMTAFSLRDGRLHNYGMDTHNMFVPLNTIPVLVLDVYEHAYMIDFGTQRGQYLEAFVKNVDWSVVENRLHHTQGHSPENKA